VLLAKADHKDPKTLATQADELWSLHDITNGGGGVAAVQENAEPDFVAAISGDRRRGGGAARGGGRSRGGKRTPKLPEPEASREARLAAGLCIKHWRYGDSASSCEAPCSWQGNGGAGGNLMRPPFSCGHRGLVQHFSPSVISSWFRSRAAEP
jgi:hypothetical protein